MLSSISGMNMVENERNTVGFSENSVVRVNHGGWPGFCGKGGAEGITTGPCPENFNRTLLENFSSRSGSRLKIISGSTGPCPKNFNRTLNEKFQADPA